jgi:hypothetical protein
MRQRETVEPRSRWLPNERGELVEYEIIEPTSGTAWEGLRGRRPRVKLKGETQAATQRGGGPR